MNNENKKIIGYDSHTGQPIYESQNNTINNQQMINQQFGTLNPNNNQSNYQQQMYQNINNQQIKKKKFKWWIPVLLFVAGLLLNMGRFVFTLLTDSQNGLISQMIFMIATICWLMVIPSLIVAIIIYNKKTPEENINNGFQVNNMINNASSIEEKMLIAFIGYNYAKIKEKKFSIQALFLSWIYTLYRKVYIPSIIGMVVIAILGFLPSAIYTILAFTFAIILGINFNRWYILFAQKQVQKIKVANPNISENELINICKKKGGTNIWLAIVIYLIFAIISSALNPNVANLDNFKQNANLKEEQEDSNSNTRPSNFDRTIIKLSEPTEMIDIDNDLKIEFISNKINSEDITLYKANIYLKENNINNLFFDGSNIWSEDFTGIFNVYDVDNYYILVSSVAKQCDGDYVLIIDKDGATIKTYTDVKFDIQKTVVSIEDNDICSIDNSSSKKEEFDLKNLK